MRVPSEAELRGMAPGDRAPRLNFLIREHRGMIAELERLDPKHRDPITRRRFTYHSGVVARLECLAKRLEVNVTG